ncbi:MAG: M15 family metallopeptidase [Casimicrobium sp.]
MPTFVLGTRSRRELQGVHADLVAVVERAIEITPIDFAVSDGIRTIDEQRKLVETGASQTMDSRHLTGHAVDLVPFVGNKVRWETALIFQIALAMRAAAQETSVPIRWGGCWAPWLTATDRLPEDMVNEYVATKRAAGERPFVDAWHFELPRERYPASFFSDPTE